MSYESLIQSKQEGQPQGQGLGQSSLAEILQKLDVVDHSVGGGKTSRGKDSSTTTAAAAHVALAILPTPDQWRRYETLLPDSVIRFGEELTANNDDGRGGMSTNSIDVDDRDDDDHSEL